MIDYSTTAEIEFGDPETIEVGQLQVGDYVVSIPAQGRTRGTNVRSAVKQITERPTGWYTQSRPRGPKFPIPSRVLAFLSTEDRFDVACSYQVIVRRPI
jgi:hypothetical protein